MVFDLPGIAVQGKDEWCVRPGLVSERTATCQEREPQRILLAVLNEQADAGFLHVPDRHFPNPRLKLDGQADARQGERHGLTGERVFHIRRDTHAAPPVLREKSPSADIDEQVAPIVAEMGDRILRTEAHPGGDRPAAKDGHEFRRLDGMERTISLDLLHVFPNLLDQRAEFIAGEVIEQRAAGGQVLQGLPDRIEEWDRIRACPPPIRRGGTKGIRKRGQDGMLTRVLAVEQGAEQVSVHIIPTVENCASSLQKAQFSTECGIPAQQQEGDRPPRAGGEEVGDGLLANPSPGELQQTG